MQISDETLMALADGELSQPESDALHQAIAADPALQSRYALFSNTRDALGLMRGTSAAVEDPLAAMIRKAQSQSQSQSQPDPEPQTQTLLQHPSRPQAQASESVPTYLDAGATPPAGGAPVAANLNHRPWLALAAGVALAAVALGWFGLGQGKDLSAPEIAALQSLPSGQSEELEGGRLLTMIASYKAETLCREYEITEESRADIILACREGAGWDVRFTAETQSDGLGYMPASGDIEALDAALAPLGAPLLPEDEAAALRE